MTRSMSDDQPQFEELTGAQLDAARAEYRRVWGEDMPTADTPEPLPHPPVKASHRTRRRR